MAVTAIISFTNMYLRELQLVALEHPSWDCNAPRAAHENTIARYVDTAMGGNSQTNCCNMWIPHCQNGSGFDRRHIELSIPQTGPGEVPTYYTARRTESQPAKGSWPRRPEARIHPPTTRGNGWRTTELTAKPVR